MRVETLRDTQKHCRGFSSIATECRGNSFSTFLLAEAQAYVLISMPIDRIFRAFQAIQAIPSIERDSARDITLGCRAGRAILASGAELVCFFRLASMSLIADSIECPSRAFDGF